MAAPAYRKGQIRLAPVSIPVEIHRAPKSGTAISFRQIHEPSGRKPGKLEASDYHNHYVAALERVIAKKKKAPVAEEKKPPAKKLPAKKAPARKRA